MYTIKYFQCWLDYLIHVKLRIPYSKKTMRKLAEAIVKTWELED